MAIGNLRIIKNKSLIDDLVKQKMKIDNYNFGSITVDGKTYNGDIIIFPNKIITNWQRKEGHSLSMNDLKEVVEYNPDILIVGTGAHGVLQVLPNTKKALEKLTIKLIIMKTPDACKIFNESLDKNLNVVGAFHLTC